MVQNRGDIVLSGNTKTEGKPGGFDILITLSGDADSLLFEHLAFGINVVTRHLHFTPLEEHFHDHRFLCSLMHPEEPNQISQTHYSNSSITQGNEEIMKPYIHKHAHMYVQTQSNKLICCRVLVWSMEETR